MLSVEQWAELRRMHFVEGLGVREKPRSIPMTTRDLWSPLDISFQTTTLLLVPETLLRGAQETGLPMANEGG